MSDNALVEAVVRAVLQQLRAPEEPPCACHGATGGCCPDRFGRLVGHGAERFGLQAGVFTRDIAKGLKAAATLEFGGVLINEVPTFRADQMPYGGVKDSGNTREGPAFAVYELTEERFVTLQG